MSRFTDALTRVQDDARVEAIRVAEATRIDEQFAPIRRRIELNAKRFRVEPEVGNFRRYSLS